MHGIEFESRNPADWAHGVTCAVFLIHGKSDKTIPYKHSEQIFERLDTFKESSATPLALVVLPRVFCRPTMSPLINNELARDDHHHYIINRDFSEWWLKRETVIEPATSSLGIRSSIVNKKHMRSIACVLSMCSNGFSPSRSVKNSLRHVVIV